MSITLESNNLPQKFGQRPWVSGFAIAVCICVFLGLAAKNDYESWDTVSKFGYLPEQSIRSGAYWALVTSAFVHVELWHLVFNIYWLWVFGSRMEKAIGSLQYLAFYTVAAFVSSSYQLTVSDSTGIGASGVVYAIFGFMWLTRLRYPQFNEVLSPRIIQFFIFWLFCCIAITYLKIMEVGNAAHISGLLFGSAVAGSFILHYKQRLMRIGLVGIVIFSIAPLFWCPWSVNWLSRKAYAAHAAQNYSVALKRYTQIIRLDPNNAWAYQNRSYVYQALDQSEKAETDLQKARELNPSIEAAR